MESDTFEKAFADFIDRREYDEAQNALFNMIRISFKAGWQSAGGNPPELSRLSGLYLRSLTSNSSYN